MFWLGSQAADEQVVHVAGGEQSCGEKEIAQGWGPGRGCSPVKDSVCRHLKEARGPGKQCSRAEAKAFDGGMTRARRESQEARAREPG